jgi:hypothetical protein
MNLTELKKLLQKAKKAYDKAQEVESEVFLMLDVMGVNLDAPTEAENADNLGEAITCYLQYGEYTVAGLLSEIREQYKSPPKYNNAE